jgi:predicted double-glycine peptidase
MSRSPKVLGLSTLTVLSLVWVGAAHAQDYHCAFGSVGRTVAVHQDVTVGQESCAVVYHKPPARPSVLWTARSDAGFCESRAEELVQTLRDGGWSCHEIPGLAPEKAIQALIEIEGPREERGVVLAGASSASAGLAAAERSVPRLKPAVRPEATAEQPRESVGGVPEAVAFAAVPVPPSELRKTAEFSPADVRAINLDEADIDPPYEVDDLPRRPSAPAPDNGQVKSLLEMRRDKVVVQEWDLSCGAAALATILNYQHDDPVTEREVAKGLIDREEYLENPDLVRARFGFSLLDLKRYVDERGYEGIGYGDLTLDDLLERAPIMVPVNFNGYNHFVVFRGVMRERVLLADPAYGNRTMTVREFESAWLSYPQFGKVGFVVARTDGLTPPNALAPLPSDFVMVN